MRARASPIDSIQEALRYGAGMDRDAARAQRAGARDERDRANDIRRTLGTNYCIREKLDLTHWVLHRMIIVIRPWSAGLVVLLTTSNSAGQDLVAHSAQYFRLANTEVVDMVRYALGYYDHEIVEEHHAITPDGAR